MHIDVDEHEISSTSNTRDMMHVWYISYREQQGETLLMSSGSSNARGRKLCRDRVHDDGESLVVSTRPEKGCEGTGSFLFALVRINDAAVE